MGGILGPVPKPTPRLLPGWVNPWLSIVLYGEDPYARPKLYGRCWWIFGSKTGRTFLPGVLKENSGGGLLSLEGVEVSGSSSSSCFPDDIAMSERLRGPVDRDGRVQSSLKICTVSVETNVWRRLVTWASTICSLASRRMRTWTEPAYVQRKQIWLLKLHT